MFIVEILENITTKKKIKFVNNFLYPEIVFASILVVIFPDISLDSGSQVVWIPLEVHAGLFRSTWKRISNSEKTS